MLGKKKPIEVPTPQEPTETQEVKILLEDRAKILEFVAKEFKETYGGVFNTKNMEEMDQEAMSLDLLFSIYAELRLLRKIMTPKKNI